MNKEYFTPDITDIRIGYECVDSYTKVRKIIQPDDIESIILNITTGLSTIETPFLTKEQIEAESWEFKDSFNYEDELREIFKKAEFIMEYNYKNNELIIRKGSWYPEETKYQGICPSINEFRYITENLLKIK